MSGLRPLLVTGLLCLLPLGARAAEVTAFSLTDSEEQRQWQVMKSVSASVVPDGIRLRARAQGSFLRPLSLDHSIDVVQISYTSPRVTSIGLLWHRRGGGMNDYYQIPLTLRPVSVPTKFTIELNAVGNWDTHPTAIGLFLPEGSEITLSSVELSGWNSWEKLVEATKCFWTTDGLFPHSINFLWGPLLCASPVARENLFSRMPPIAHSGMRVIYAFLLLGFLCLLTHWWLTGDHSRPRVLLKRFLLLSLVVWVFLDLRMGWEFLMDWQGDRVMYLEEPAGKRVFRSLRFLPDFAESIRSLAADQPRYVLIAPSTLLFMNYLSYQTFPSKAVTPAGGSGATLWLVYDRPDLTIDPEGYIVGNGVRLSPHGTLVHEFIRGTFAFRVQP